MLGTLTLTSPLPKIIPSWGRAAMLRAQVVAATETVDLHTVVCACVDDPCDTALQLAEAEIVAWDHLEHVTT
jgi:hypothetical protein